MGWGLKLELSQLSARSGRLRFNRLCKASTRPWSYPLGGQQLSDSCSFNKPRRSVGRFLEPMTTGTQGAVLALGMRQRVEHLVGPVLVTVEPIILQSDRGRVLARDVGGAEQHVPEEKQVAEVAAVVANPVGVAQGVMLAWRWSARPTT